MSKNSLLNMAAQRAGTNQSGSLTQPKPVGNIVGGAPKAPSIAATLQAPAPTTFSAANSLAPQAGTASPEAPAARPQTAIARPAAPNPLDAMSKNVKQVQFQGMEAIQNQNPLDKNTALENFTQTVGGQYGNTPWSQALQASLNQYSKVWEETKQQLNQQFANTDRGAAANAAASGYSPFGAASASMSQQATVKNASALSAANQEFGTNMSNLMGRYGDTLFNAIASDVNTRNQASQFNANALNQSNLTRMGIEGQRQLTGLSNQAAMDRQKDEQAFQTQLLNQELAAQPGVPGRLKGEADTQLTNFINQGVKGGVPVYGSGVTITGASDDFRGQRNQAYNAAKSYSYTDDSGKQVTIAIPKVISDLANDYAFKRPYKNNTYDNYNLRFGNFYNELVNYYGSYTRAAGHEPSAADVKAYMDSLGYKRRV